MAVPHSQDLQTARHNKKTEYEESKTADTRFAGAIGHFRLYMTHTG
jgi:hypothetical protein